MGTESLLRYQRPYDWRADPADARCPHGARSEELDLAAGHYRRLVPTSAGAVAIELRTAGPARVLVDHDDTAVVGEVIAGLRHWLDLDHDPEALAPLRSDPTVGPLLAHRPGIRRIGYPAGFEAVVLTILGQQVSLAAGRTFAGRLIMRLRRGRARWSAGLPGR